MERAFKIEESLSIINTLIMALNMIKTNLDRLKPKINLNVYNKKGEKDNNFIKNEEIEFYKDCLSIITEKHQDLIRLELSDEVINENFSKYLIIFTQIINLLEVLGEKNNESLIEKINILNILEKDLNICLSKLTM